MTPAVFLQIVVDPTLHDLASVDIPITDNARVLLMAIAGQESDWRARRQIGGPARGYWQFEEAGGVAEVLATTPQQLGALCAALDIPVDRATLYEAMAWNDILACGMARLLLWQDPAPLPAVGDVQGGWDYYQRNWRPGAPRPDAWPAYYATAKGLIS
jgi:hypothetical protein